MADFAVQRGVASIANTASTVTITAGVEYTAPASVTAGFIRLVGTHTTSNRNGGSNNLNANDSMAYISNPGNITTSITFTRYDVTDAAAVAWEIIEYVGSASGANEFIVRGVGAVEVTTTDLTGTTGAVSNVATDADVVPWLTGQGSGVTAVRSGLFYLVWNSGADTITGTRTIPATASATFSWAAVEFTGSNWTVETVTLHTIATGGATETETLTTAVTTTRAFLHVSYNLAGDNNDDGVMVWLSATDTVSYLTAAGATTGAVIAAYCISNSQTDGTPMVVARYTDTTNFTTTTFDQTVTAVTLAVATVEEFTCFTGQTTASASAQVVAGRLETTTNIEMWRSRALDTVSFRVATVGWPTVSAGGAAATTGKLVDGGLIGASLVGRSLVH